MNKSIFFIIFLIAPFAFANHDALNKLDKSIEGKEMLDSLFIQTQLMGDNLDVDTLKTFLKGTRDAIATKAAEYETIKAAKLAECNSDLESLSTLRDSHDERQFALKRQLELVKRTAARIGTFLARSQDESSNYSKFQSFIKEGKDAWATYFASATANFKALGELLKTVVEATNAPATGASFIQMGSEYHSALAEIKLTVQTINLKYTGMGPIVSNLVEIMADPNAAGKPEVRHALRGLVEALNNNVRDRLEEIEAENEHQSALFEHLEKAFHENVLRSNKEVQAHTDVTNNLNSRVNSLTAAHNHAKDLTSKIENIKALRGDECETYNHANTSVSIRSEKINSVINEIEGIVINKSAGIKTFFIQREMRATK
jgi:hypothetical protein